MAGMTTRRGLLAAAASGIASTGALGAVRQSSLAELKKEADVACLYHCDFGQPDRFSQLLTNISNHYSVYGGNPFDVQLCVVAHGAGVKFFLETLEGTPWSDETTVPKIFERVPPLAKLGLKVYLCSITFERQRLDREKARRDDFISFVPSGVATVAAMQAKGFAYIKIG
ncbi:MAG: DsrE family protein [Bosea sp. (in: a-proteobacteria)]